MKYKKYNFKVFYSGSEPMNVECTHESCGTLTWLSNKRVLLIERRVRYNMPTNARALVYNTSVCAENESEASYIAQEISKICAKCPYNKINKKTR